MTEKAKEIRDKIKSQGRSIAWVGVQIGLSSSSMSQRFNGKIPFKDSELKIIDIILK